MIANKLRELAKMGVSDEDILMLDAANRIDALESNAEKAVATEMLLLETERQLDYEKRKAEIFQRGFNKVRAERNAYRRGFDNLVWYIGKMMCATEDQFVKGTVNVAYELDKQIKEQIKK